MSKQYLSASKFVQTINELFKDNKFHVKNDKYETINFVYVWFQGKYCYEGKFDNMLIEPVYLKIHTSRNRDIFIKHEELLEVFKPRMILSIKRNFKRNVPKGKDREDMYYVEINFEEQKSSNGEFTYYNIEIYKETCKSIKETIEKQIISLKPKEENDFLN